MVQPSPASTVAALPEGAVRMRCYRLNMDSGPTSSSQQQQQHRCGPIEYCRPSPSYLGSSVSEDSSALDSSVNAALSTARIFRGLTISRDGTVRSKKTGKSSKSSSSDGKGKADEKSRQAAKIDKAKDIVEQSANNKGKNENGSSAVEDSNMVSLVIMGEYDDMKHLVRDGSKRLKESEGLSDDVLLSHNHPRVLRPTSSLSSAPVSNHHHHNSHHTESNRKRAQGSSSNMAGLGGGNHHPTPAKIKQNKSTPVAVKENHNASANINVNVHINTPPTTATTSPMPKLKENPRDTRPVSARTRDTGTRTSSRRFAAAETNCNHLPWTVGGDSDWSGALGFGRGFHSIWNCGVGAAGDHSSSNNHSTHEHPHHHSHHRTVSRGVGGYEVDRRDEGPSNRRDPPMGGPNDYDRTRGGVVHG